jgi:cephalosporin-C deacetylase-like acetyl esterase
MTAVALSVFAGPALAQTEWQIMTGPDAQLSPDWYGRTEFSGSLEGVGAVAVLVRYAADTEGYRLVVDTENRDAYLEERHLGTEHRLVSIGLGDTNFGGAIRFHILANGRTFEARLWAVGEESSARSIGCGDLKVPEGRAGFQAIRGEWKPSRVGLSGEARSQFPVYAFHCNYKLPDKQASQALWRYLDEVGTSLAARQRHAYRTADEAEQHRNEAVAHLRRSLGLDPWPERTPLNARVKGVIRQREYRIEKIVFESQRGFLVDALLYLPEKRSGRVPGVVSTIGHYAENDFFIWSEQARSIGLARKGYAVLTYDPIGQGERIWLGGGNHDLLRRKIVLAGMEVSGLMFWDSIRAIDYLISRPEVDPERIGITGVSGGGFNALYTAALDDRVKAAAPDGFATSLESLIKRGDAGCCAYIPNLARYAEIPEIYGLIAPRKLLILGGYMDILSDRILQVFETARRYYDAHGASANVAYYLDPDAGHTYSKPMRLALYRYFGRWLKGSDDPAEGREDPDSEQFLISRESGQLRVMDPDERGKNVTELMREYLESNQVLYPPPESREAAVRSQQQIRAWLAELMGDMAPPAVPAVVREERSGRVRKVVLRGERNLVVPLVIHESASEPRGLVVYLALADRSPVSDLGTAVRVKRLVGAGYTAVVPEVRGAGSSAATDMPSVELFSMALGKHLFSTRIWDVQRAIDFIRSEPAYKGLRLSLWGEGVREGPMALYLAALDARVDQAISSHGLISYRNSVDEDGLPDFDYYVPGLLRYADVPQMIGAVAPRRVVVAAPVDIHQRVVSHEQAGRAYEWASQVYHLLGGEFAVVQQSDLQSELR